MFVISVSESSIFFQYLHVCCNKHRCRGLSGGQYTNLLFQSQQLGLSGRWPQIKRAYESANRLLGDIIKVRCCAPVVARVPFVGAGAEVLPPVLPDLRDRSIFSRRSEPVCCIGLRAEMDFDGPVRVIAAC